ncbi:hypothetical protein Clacol_000339 [Clathrus columnatus]|uniref:HlyIII-domain-containing protein n=1 Tax=Clathrus columnatus TaxID=1419009 RepID=A0AAV4ZWZ7_9AGAM|nr:hypothetical protein Clacol_000339 [Clathrus columnatus]
MPLLAKLRVAILEHLKDLETNLSQLDPYLIALCEERDVSSRDRSSRDSGEASTSRAHLRRRGSLSAAAIEETRARVRDVLDMLQRIRSDVYSYLPEMQTRMPSLDDMRSHIQHLPRKETFEKLMVDNNPALYLPRLRSHLESLHDHIHSLKLPSSFSKTFPSFTIRPYNGIIADFLYKLQDPAILTDPLKTPLDVIGTLGESRPSEAELAELEHQFELQIKRALEESKDGRRLIPFEYVPRRYQYNHHVRTGYRFIPLSAWPRLLLSVFQFHNETANILTHLLPLLYSLRAIWTTIPPFPHFIQSISTNLSMAESAEDIIDAFDIPRRAFVFAANLCLLCSCICASILPFTDRFNAPANKNGRLAFFISLAVVAVVPLTHLAAIHSIWDTYFFIRPEIPSILSYSIGVIFYAFHIPERFVPDEWKWCTDLLGGGSHAIWHVCIIIGALFYRYQIHYADVRITAMVHYRNGVGNETLCQLTWDW